jgi:hypothetical protein
MIRKKNKTDRLLRTVVSEMSIDDHMVAQSWPEELTITGDLDIGKSGNPVTIIIEDEITGETLEISNVKTAFLMLEDVRSKNNGWLTIAMGKSTKLLSVLSYMSQITIDGLKKLIGM